MKRQVRKTRSGFSLLELVVATAMLATMVTAVAVLFGTSQNAWEAGDSDQTRLEAAHAVVRHLVRHLRQANDVLSISTATETSGSISARMPDGTVFVWNHAGDQVLFGVDVADNLLAEGIAELNFVGYQADGNTTTEVATEIQSVLCGVRVDLSRETGGQRMVRSWAWLRAW